MHTDCILEFFHCWEDLNYPAMFILTFKEVKIEFTHFSGRVFFVIQLRI